MWWFVLAGMSWTIAMHLYSAVPDIDADRDAELHTTAMQLGAHSSLLLCLVLYFSSFTIAGVLLSPWFYPLGIPYLLLVWATFSRSTAARISIYRWFPYLNAVSGFLISMYLLLQLV
jgi:4-hydroxybenzoate polyprenyltransferase